MVPTALTTSKVAVAANAASTAVIIAFISKITVSRKSARQMHITIVEAVLSPLNNFFFVLVVLDIIFTFVLLFLCGTVLSGLYSAESAISSGVFFYGSVKVVGCVVGPEYIIDINFRISRLPEKIV